jgi:hypothetical protein
MFIVNDKGTSWAYATPGFANSLNQTVLKQLRGLADVPEQAKLFTEVGNTQQLCDASCSTAVWRTAFTRKCIALSIAELTHT